MVISSHNALRLIQAIRRCISQWFISFIACEYAAGAALSMRADQHRRIINSAGCRLGVPVIQRGDRPLGAQAPNVTNGLQHHRISDVDELIHFFTNCGHVFYF